MLEETKRLSRLVNDLLEASRLEQGKISINKEDTDINRIVAEAVFSYEKQLLDKKIDDGVIDDIFNNNSETTTNNGGARNGLR